MAEGLEVIAEKTRQYIRGQTRASGQRVSYFDVVNHLRLDGVVEDRVKEALRHLHSQGVIREHLRLMKSSGPKVAYYDLVAEPTMDRRPPH